MSTIFIKSQNNTKYFHSSLAAGSGKSYTTYKRIAQTNDKTIIVVPRINLMEEQLQLFNGKAIAVHSYDGKPKSVTEKIMEAIKVVEASDNDKQVLIITHNGFLQYTRWKELQPAWNLIIDEYMDYYTTIDLELTRSSRTKEYWKLFDITDECDTYANIEFSKEAKTMFRENNDIWSDSNNMKTLYSLSKNNKLAIKLNEYGTEIDNLTTLCLLNADMFESFVTVTFLADGFNKSPLYNYLATAYKIEFNELDIKPYKQRNKEVHERITIYQIAERNSSNYMFTKMTAEHFKNISKAVNQIAITDNTIWTANSRFKENYKINGTYLTPKQSGTNEYNKKTTAVWLASMKTAVQHINATKDFINMEADKLDEVKELEPAHQFVTRTNIRDYTSNNKIDVIVFGPQQAEYLAERYGISKTKIIHLNVEVPVKLSAGRKATLPQSITPAEKEKFRRCLKAVNEGKLMKEELNKWFVNMAKETGKYEERFNNLPNKVMKTVKRVKK